MQRGIFLLLLLFWVCGQGKAQCPSSRTVWDSLLRIEDKADATDAQKLIELYALQKRYTDCRLPPDSVYARLLHRIGTCEFSANNNTATAAGIRYTTEAARINSLGGKDRAAAFAANSYMNLGYYYRSLLQYPRALAYFDTAVVYAEKHGGKMDFILHSRLNKCLILIQMGDYQKAIEESTLGIVQARKEQAREMILYFLNQRALCFYYEHQYSLAAPDLDSAVGYARSLKDDFELASAYKGKALIENHLQPLFDEAIGLRKKTGNFSQVSDDYIDLGNYYVYHNAQYAKANEAYAKALEYARKTNSNEGIAKVYTNEGLVSFYQGRYEKALDSYSRAFKFLLQTPEAPGVADPGSAALRPILNKELVFWILANRVEASLHRYRRGGQRADLELSLHTALLADTLLTVVRHEQTSEQSKLFWRNRMREIFTNALEACYLSNDTRLAFFFMESSRAVLLNDKLNELGAQAHLPTAEAQQEQQYLLNAVSTQQKAASFAPGAAGYDSAQWSFLRAKEESERYIRSLEARYPAYYRYKYSGEVPGLQQLQAYLAVNKACFVHYYTNDTLLYILSVTANNAKLIRIGASGFDPGQLTAFLRQCADQQYLSSHYDSFAVLSHQLYTLLFGPLALPSGRVIICSDNFLLPFEALCTDKAGRHFLLNDYIFSYVYSAGYLLSSHVARKPTGNFIGFAPVSFRPGLQLPDLKKSAAALETVGGYYSHKRLFTEAGASKKNFLGEIADYSVVCLFSHARADTGNDEPLLYLQDSVIRLSELQMLPGMATCLVGLSACQTNVGKHASGEGVYSLARGFAAAGVPSVAATVWEAEDLAIYEISDKFYQYLAAGEDKDVALQRAKLDFMRQGDRQKMLPYYWANMILVGNSSPVPLTAARNNWWGLGAGIILLLLLTAGMIARRRQ